LSNAHSVESAHSTLEQVEKRYILNILEQTSWVIEGDRGAAKILDLHPNTLRSRMKKLGIDRSNAKADVSHATSNPREAAI
jgi:transcriptional regulator with GAF, ATPase, and Fis domain